MSATRAGQRVDTDVADPDARGLDDALDDPDEPGAGWCLAGWLAAGLGLAWWFLTVPSTGLMVNTDSIMPATRQTASTLAISGMMPAWAGMTRRSRRRRLRARCSRW